MGSHSSKEMVPREGNWKEEEIKNMNDDCDVAMKFLDDSPIVSQIYKNCLQRGRKAIIAKIMKSIMNKGHFMINTDSQECFLCWSAAPKWLAEFLLDLEVVFIADGEIKIKKETLDVPAIEVATSAAANIAPLQRSPLQRSPACWEENDIESLYRFCENAVMFIDNSPEISEIYRHCLRRGRDAIIENIMDFIMNTGYFKKQDDLSGYFLHWRDAPQGLARFLQCLEPVFTGGEEVKIRKKRAFPVAVATVTAAAKAIISSLALSAAYDVLKEGLTSLYEEEHAAKPPIAILVAFVEAPDPRVRSGVLRTYAKMRFGSHADSLKEEDVEFLKGKRLLNEKWAEEGQHYDLSADTNAVLCMHLWFLMKYAGFSDSVTIWNAISNGWPECVSWKPGFHRLFWDILPKTRAVRPALGFVETISLSEAAKLHGLESMLDAYNDMERHIIKQWPISYPPQETS